MTRVGYLTIVSTLLLLSLSGIFTTVFLSHRAQREPERIPCARFLETPREGRFRLMGCMVFPNPGSNTGESCSVDVAHVATWRTRDPEMMRMTASSPDARRALERFTVNSRTADIVVDASFDDDHWFDPRPQLRDPHDPKLGLGLGMLPFFVFGIPLLVLVRSQQRWRAERLAWERTQGVVTEGDKPASF